MSLPKGDEVQAQAQSAVGAAPSPTAAPCPSGDVPKEGSRDIQKKGKIISVPYDWCKSNDSPIPYRIWAWQSSSSNLANTVRQTDCGSHVLGSFVNECYGDEPGKGGGIHSGTYQAECTPMTASATVRAEGRPMVRYLDKWHMNHGNTWGCLNNSEDMGKYDPPRLQNIKPKMKLAFEQTPGTQTDAPSPATTPQEIPQENPADGIVRKGLVRGAIAVGATVTALATAILVASTTSTAKDDVRVTRLKRKCGPCITIKGRIVPVGTIGWLFHRVPPSRPHYPYKGDHYNLFRAQQNPFNCRCFWQPYGDQEGANGAPAPLGSMPIEEFSNIE